MVGCRSPEANPELRDPIYSFLKAKEAQVAGQIAGETKALEEAAGVLKKAVPQSGQVKFAKKHYYTIKDRLEKLEQQRRYYEIRQKSRIAEARESYLQAFHKKEEWPRPEEFEEFKIQESAREKSRNWSVKERIQEELGEPSGP